MTDDIKEKGKKVKFPSASSMAKKESSKPKKRKNAEEEVRMMGFMSLRRGPGDNRAA